MGKVSKLGICFLYILNEKIKEDCISIATSILSRERNDLFLKTIIISDEKWVFYEYVHKIDKDEFS